MVFAVYKHALILKLKRLYYGKRGEPYRINGHTLRYMPGSRLVRLKYRDSQNAVTRNDACQVELIANRVKQGDLVLDVGAHAGAYAILMSACAGPNGQVISFEPDPYAREQLLANLKLNPSIKPPIIESYACSDTCGEAILYSRGGNSNSSLAISGVGNHIDEPEAIKTQTITLDKYIADKQIRTPSWVKIDAEGAEIRILAGATKLLSSKAQFVVELHPYTWKDFGNSYQQLLELVARSGRRMVMLDGSSLKSEPEYSTVLLERE